MNRCGLHDVSPPPPPNLFADARCADALAAVIEKPSAWGVPAAAKNPVLIFLQQHIQRCAR